MPNPLTSPGGGSKNSSEKSSASLDSKNEDKEKVTARQKGSGSKNMSAAKYRAILLQRQGREKKKKSDKKKKKLIVRLKVGNDLGQGVNEKIGDGCFMEGGSWSGIKVKGVKGGLSGCSDTLEQTAKIGDEREMDSNGDCLEEGEIRAKDTVPPEPEEDGRKVNAKVYRGEISEECCEDVQPRGAVLVTETGSEDNVCVICKLGGSATLLCCDGKGCKKNYHLNCLDSPRKDAPPGDWLCVFCVKKGIESGVLFSPATVESNLDAEEVELADSEGVDTTKNNLRNNNDSNDGIKKVEEKPVRVVASDSKFVEYYVPAKLSEVQLEQYCDILLSNSALLRSCSKNDTVEALRDVLISTRKCCDHPYFVDPSLQKILTDGLSEAKYLNVGIKASGKLKVLDKILSETKKQGLRVVIIFQSSVGSSEISLGDVLDDVVCQRCGVGSYERVDCGLIVPNNQFARNRQASMNKFNDKEKGRIVFLLDRRACHPSIRLSSVDIVILYDNDLNPYNDLKVLQKITIDPQHEQLKVFRLYSLGTLEEMILIHAEQGGTVDAQNLNHSTLHLLLRWGASNLFKELAEFHGSSSSSGPIFSSEHLVRELFGQLPQDAASRSTIDSSIVVKVNQTGGTYIRDISLPGMQSIDKDLPNVFWTKLLNRKTPKWRYLPAASTQRIRKRVQFFEDSPEEEGFGNGIATKKRRKVLTGATDAGAHKEGASRTPACDCSQFLPSPAVPTVARSLQANDISSVPAACMGVSDKKSVQQELKGEIRESHQSCEMSLPPPSEPPCPEPLGEDQVVQWHPATNEHTVLPSHDVVAPLELKLQLPIPIKRSLGGSGTCISESKIAVPDPTNHPGQSAPVTSSTSQSLLHRHKAPNQVGLVINSAPQPNTQIDYGIPSGRNTSQLAEFSAATETHSVLPSYNDALQVTMPQLPMVIDRGVGGSVTRVSDFTSLGVIPDCISRPLQIPPLSSSQPSQTLLQDDPLLHELLRIRQEREQAVKFHEDLKMQMGFDFLEEVQEINRKYDKLHHDNDTAFARTSKALHTNYNKFLFHKMLAEAFRDKML